MLDKDEWCIVRYGVSNTDLLVRRMYQWEAHADMVNAPWEVVARGLTEKQAMEFEKLFKE